MTTEYCAFGTSICLGPEVWAAWVQAVGSVIAIVAAVAVVDFQLWKQEKARIAIEREREMAMCRDAFLAAISYQLAMREYDAMLPEQSAGNSRHLKFPHVWLDFHDGGYSPRELAFLILRQANDVLMSFYKLDYRMREWVNRIDRLFKYRNDRISPLLEVRSRELDRLLNDEEQLALIGPFCSAEMARLTEKIEVLTREGRDDFTHVLPFLKRRLGEIYPELELPALPD